MKRVSVIRVLSCCLALSAALVVGCKDKEDPATVPVPTANATTAAAAQTTAPAAAATDAPSGTPTGGATAPTQPPTGAGPVTTTPQKNESIDACCSALNAVAKSGKSATAKSKAASAAAVCPGVAKLVKAGTTSRSAGLSQIRSALVGFDVPGECR